MSNNRVDASMRPASERRDLVRGRTSWGAVAEVREHPVMLFRAAHDVGGFEIAVRISRCMECLQPLPHLPYHLHCHVSPLVRRKLAQW